MTTGREPKYSVKRLGANLLAGVFVIAAASVSMPAYSSVPLATFAADCTTQQTTFNLGDTVCAKAVGLTGLRFQWVDADGFAVATTDITADPQTNSFGLPTTDQSALGGFFTVNNLGRWRVNAVTLRNSAKVSAFFTVRDPNSPKVDLSIFKSMIGSVDPAPGSPFQFLVTIVNNGPNDAVNTHFVDNVFMNASFDSLTQTGGPTFTCSGADCQVANFPNGAQATFILSFTAGTAAGLLENTATVSSNTPELNSTDNSSVVAPIEIIAGSAPPPTCDPHVTAPAAVTLFTGPAATSCAVVVDDLDATLGTASATDTCVLVGGITRSGVPSGNNFPVGATTITYSVTDTMDDTASATQIVTVVDNTPPRITCPLNMTLEPTCQTGAVATWTEPSVSDNCPGATATQNAGPPNGSVFPIGMTTPVSYVVSDAAGNQASCAFSVTVLTVSATIQKLETSINASSLNGPQKQGLLPKLDATLDDFNRGQTNAACNVLDAFIHLVQTDIDHGDVLAAQGQAWINSAKHVSNTIGCTSNPCS